MQTFLPLADFRMSARVLDYRRLGKQRVEALQILNALRSGGGWSSHPASVMWRGCEAALEVYHDVMVREWVARGYKNTMTLFNRPMDAWSRVPWWFGDDAFHASHRSNLLRKNPEFYQWFRWSEGPDLPYVWPDPVQKEAA